MRFERLNQGGFWEGRASEAKAHTSSIHQQIRQYVAEIPYSTLEQVFEPMSRTSDFMVVLSGFDLGDACARLGDSFRKAGVPEQFCEYDSLICQLAQLINKRVASLHCRRRRL